MSKHDIVNLKRQITLRRVCASERALQRCLAWKYGFTVKTIPPTSPRNGPTYALLCAGIELGRYEQFASTSMPEVTLRNVWNKCGAARPWEDEPEESRRQTPFKVCFIGAGLCFPQDFYVKAANEGEAIAALKLKARGAEVLTCVETSDVGQVFAEVS